MDRTYLQGILNKRLENYMDEASNDLKLTEMNIKEKSLLRSSLGAKWCRYKFEEEKYIKVLKNNIELLREEIKKKLYEKQNLSIANADTNRQRLINMDAEKILIKTQEYQKYKQEIDNQEDIIRLIDETQKLISQFGYDIKNALEVIKLENI